MTGTSWTPMLFSPHIDTTKAMIVTVLYRLEGNPDVSGLSNPFTDVEGGKWYADAVKWAAANGIVEGIGGGLFAPEAGITRQDMAVIIARYMTYAEINIPVTQQYVLFADEAEISGYAKNAVQLLNKLGIINGTGSNADGQATIDPKAGQPGRRPQPCSIGLFC